MIYLLYKNSVRIAIPWFFIAVSFSESRENGTLNIFELNISFSNSIKINFVCAVHH